MRDPLATYIQDHLAGSKTAIDLLENMREQHGGEPLGQFASDLLVQVEEDRAVLDGLAERVGAAHGLAIKEAIALLTEKGARVKLRRSAAKGLGTLQSLETLALGILGKLALWRALAVVAAGDTRLNGVDFDHLAARAQAQHARVEGRRLEAARTALRFTRSDAA